MPALAAALALGILLTSKRRHESWAFPPAAPSAALARRLPNLWYSGSGSVGIVLGPLSALEDASGGRFNTESSAPRTSVDVYNNGDRAHPPLPGDMLVWNNGTYGNVALITAVRAGAVDIIEQNVSGNGKATLGYDGASIALDCAADADKGAVRGRNPVACVPDRQGGQLPRLRVLRAAAERVDGEAVAVLGLRGAGGEDVEVAGVGGAAASTTPRHQPVGGLVRVALRDIADLAAWLVPRVPLRHAGQADCLVRAQIKGRVELAGI